MRRRLWCHEAEIYECAECYDGSRRYDTDDYRLRRRALLSCLRLEWLLQRLLYRLLYRLLLQRLLYRLLLYIRHHLCLRHVA